MTQDRELADVLALLEKATPGEWSHAAEYGWNIATDDYDQMSRTAGSVGTAIRPQDAQAICASVNFLRQHGLALLAALSTPSSEGDGRDGERYRWLRSLPDDAKETDWLWSYQGEGLDTAIDSAIAAAAGGS